MTDTRTTTNEEFYNQKRAITERRSNLGSSDQTGTPEVDIDLRGMVRSIAQNPRGDFNITMTVPFEYRAIISDLMAIHGVMVDIHMEKYKYRGPTGDS